jgi:two-component system chemotaxis sensor kinase CheA
MIDAKEQEFLQRLRATFRIEAEENLRLFSAGLIELETATEPERRAEIVESVFRQAHSLKGAARSVNLKDVESICQPLESLLAILKRQMLPLSPALFDLLLQAVDCLARLITATGDEQTSIQRAQVRDLNRRLSEAARGVWPPDALARAVPGLDLRVAATGLETAEVLELPPERPEPPAPIEWAVLAEPVEAYPDQESPVAAARPEDGPVTRVNPRAAVDSAPAETVRISITKLDPLLRQAEEMIQAKLAAAQRAAELRDIQQVLFAWKTEASKWQEQGVRQPAEAPVVLAARLESLAAKVASVSQAFEQDQRALRHMVDVHLDAMKQVLMLPVSTLVEVFPRLVRDLARDQGKEADLVVTGAEIEIDKRILQDLKDPLIHLVRNSVDHGIEKPEARARRQKPARGTVTLAFSAKDGRQVEIAVSDDGAGVDVNRVQAAAVKAGSLTSQAAGKLSRQDSLPLIFQSGLSTSAMITDISGRGLGLAIVREKVEKLGGMVLVESQPGLGTTFRLRVPLTLATFRGVLVRARDQMFILPTAQVERVVRVRQDEIQTIENRETIRLDGHVLALVRLEDVLGLPARQDGPARQNGASPLAAPDHVPVLILTSAENRLAVQVGEVLAEEEVLVKGLGKQLSRVRNIAGATVLGAGTVVPVLNVSDLMSSAVRPGGVIGAPLAVAKTEVQTGRLLVADDSITARTLLKNILETSGHKVTTAVDGADAFTLLRSGEYDLVVSDVDMPRMSGFELTTKIRADKKLSEIPVVLVTALESRLDRERGIEVGASAYIIKSSFDQSNLLEVIHRLL